MALMLKVIDDNGSTCVVRAGQREMAKWEGQPFGCGAIAAFHLKPMTFYRYVAWAAMNRSKATYEDYETWSSHVDEVVEVDDEEPVTADPFPRKVHEDH